MEFNALCTPVHHCPNTDNMHHTYVTASDCQWPPAHPQHNTTHIHDNNEIDDNNNKKYEERQQQHHNHYNHHLKPWYLHQWLDNGPNDAWWVFFFLFVFFYTKQYGQLLKIYWSYGGLREGSGEENGPKRHDTRRLGHSVSFLFSSSCFFIY